MRYVLKGGANVMLGIKQMGGLSCCLLLGDAVLP